MAIVAGTGDFDADYMLRQLPSTLRLEQRHINRAVREAVGSKRRMLMVQVSERQEAISLQLASNVSKAAVCAMFCTSCDGP